MWEKAIASHGVFLFCMLWSNCRSHLNQIKSPRNWTTLWLPAVTLFHVFSGRGNHSFFPAFQLCVRAVISLITIEKVHSRFPSWLPTPHPHCSRFLCTGSCTICFYFFSCSVGLSAGPSARLCKDTTTGTSAGTQEGSAIGTECMAAPSTARQLVLHPTLTKHSAGEACLPSFLCRGKKFGLIYDRICQI